MKNCALAAATVFGIHFADARDLGAFACIRVERDMTPAEWQRHRAPDAVPPNRSRDFSRRYPGCRDGTPANKASIK